MLVVMEEIVMNPNLVGIHDPSARTVGFRRLIWTWVVLNRNPVTAPAGDLHIGNLDIDTSDDAYTDLFD
jgi:hypothetical protein